MTRPSPGTMLGQAAEAALVALAIGGDEAAFSELVGRRQSWLRNLLRRLCRDPSLADDLAQQALLDAWRALPDLRSATAFGPWLRQLAVNLWLRQLRKHPAEHRPAFEAESEPLVLHSHGEAIDLDRALALLASDERICIVFAYSEGMSHGEISAATRLPLGTVKSHIKRGSERLRQILHDYRSEASRHVR